MFVAASVELSGGFSISSRLERAFELFSPMGETLWVPDWNPELLHPPGTEWARGLIFRTQEEEGEAVWVVTNLDRERHEVEYHRVEPTRYVARVHVQCRARDVSDTEVKITYSFVGLSNAGNRQIEAMSERTFEEKMKRWHGWIGTYLSRNRGQTLK
jgi:hypothetical protein